MDQLDQLRLQTNLIRELYVAERTRIDHIRGSLGLPLAALSFSAVGLAALARFVRLDFSGNWASVLSGLTVCLAVGALVFLGLAVIRLRRLDYSVSPVSPSVSRFAATAQDLAAEYQDFMTDYEQEAQLAASCDALQEICDGYLACISDMGDRNEEALALQGRVFRDLLAGLLMLLVAIFLSGALRILTGTS